MSSTSPHSLRFWSQSGILLLLLLLGAPAATRGSILYSGVQNISIPQDLGGVYLNILLPFSGSSTNGGTEPASWTSAPWINPIFGGVSIGSSALLRPEVTGGSQVLRLAMGTVIDSSATYAAGESGSTTHVGAGGNQFQIGASAFLGFVMKTTTGSPLYYGWLRLIIDNSGAGTIQDWAYDNTAGTSIQAGNTGTGFVPEPSRTTLTLLAATALLLRRRRAMKMAS